MNVLTPELVALPCVENDVGKLRQPCEWSVLRNCRKMYQLLKQASRFPGHSVGTLLEYHGNVHRMAMPAPSDDKTRNRPSQQDPFVRGPPGSCAVLLSRRFWTSKHSTRMTCRAPDLVRNLLVANHLLAWRKKWVDLSSHNATRPHSLQSSLLEPRLHGDVQCANCGPQQLSCHCQGRHEGLSGEQTIQNQEQVIKYRIGGFLGWRIEPRHVSILCRQVAVCSFVLRGLLIGSGGHFAFGNNFRLTSYHSPFVIRF